MVRRDWQLRSLLVVFPFAAACGSTLGSAGPKTSRPTPAPAHTSAAAPVAQAVPVAAPQPPAEDPVLTLIAASEGHFKTGQTELGLGRFEAAKQEFNRAVDLLLESPYGGRTEPRIREHFDRLVDRISAYELKAVAPGDGFTEKRYEPAVPGRAAGALDDNGAAGGLGVKSQRPADPQASRPDIPIPLND